MGRPPAWLFATPDDSSEAFRKGQDIRFKASERGMGRLLQRLEEDVDLIEERNDAVQPTALWVTHGINDAMFYRILRLARRGAFKAVTIDHSRIAFANVEEAKLAAEDLNASPIVALRIHDAAITNPAGLVAFLDRLDSPNLVDLQLSELRGRPVEFGSDLPSGNGPDELERRAVETLERGALERAVLEIPRSRSRLRQLEYFDSRHPVTPAFYVEFSRALETNFSLLGSCLTASLDDARAQSSETGGWSSYSYCQMTQHTVWRNQRLARRTQKAACELHRIARVLLNAAPSHAARYLVNASSLPPRRNGPRTRSRARLGSPPPPPSSSASHSSSGSQAGFFSLPAELQHDILWLASGDPEALSRHQVLRVLQSATDRTALSARQSTQPHAGMWFLQDVPDPRLPRKMGKTAKANAVREHLHNFGHRMLWLAEVGCTSWEFDSEAEKSAWLAQWNGRDEPAPPQRKCMAANGNVYSDIVC